MFVELAGMMVGNFDVTDLLQRLVEHSVSLLEADAAGLLLSDQRGTLQLMASSSEATRLLELFQLQSHEGPCLDCFSSGQQVGVPNLEDMADRWPRFVMAASAQGFRGVQAVPLRLRDEVIGAMNIFSVDPRTFSADERGLAQSLADASTIAILQERVLQHNQTRVEQLQGALNSRVIIEQAKGLLASVGTLDMDEAYNQLRHMARSTNRRLADVARDLVEGRMVRSGLDDPAAKETRPDPGTSRS